MQIAIYSIVLLVLVFFVYVLLRAREKLRELRHENDTLITIVTKLRHELDVETRHGVASRLAGKLQTARAPVAAQIERYKHQNNEMRVFMSAIHRHLDDIVGAARISARQPEVDSAAVRKAVDHAMTHWLAVNGWLSKNTIEPYTGNAPGVAHG